MPAALTRLDDVARRARPVTLAGERVLPVPGPLGELLPGAALQRGTVLAVEGAIGAGATTVGLQLAAAATAAGEWAAAVELGASIGGLAAAEAGVVLERFALIRRVPPARWATVVAALLEGFTLVVVEVPRSVRAGDARRLAARARERGAILAGVRGWPVEAALRLRAVGRRDGALQVEVDGRGSAARVQQGALAAAG